MSYRVKDQHLESGDAMAVGQHHRAKIFVPVLDAVQSEQLLNGVRERFAAGDLVSLYYHGASDGDTRKLRLIEVGQARIVEVRKDGVEFVHVGEIERYDARKQSDDDKIIAKPVLSIVKHRAGGYSVKDAVTGNAHEWFGSLPEAEEYVAREGAQDGSEASIEEEEAELRHDAPKAPEAAQMTVKRGKGEYLVLDANGAALETFRTKKDAEQYVADYGAPQEAEAA